ncbi:MAG: hypothetical protein N3Z29_01570 [Synechococcaceae cyanobacterium MAG-AL1]|nr:hypothetical protein [Candidatus Regnicoccus frigidus MAG-AL1]
MAQAEDPLWSQTDHLLLRAESLLHTCAAELDQCREQRRLDREHTKHSLEALGLPLKTIHSELRSLLEAMATGPADQQSQPWHDHLQAQLAPMERVLIELERWRDQLDQVQDSATL